MFMAMFLTASIVGQASSTNTFDYYAKHANDHAAAMAYLEYHRSRFLKAIAQEVAEHRARLNAEAAGKGEFAAANATKLVTLRRFHRKVFDLGLQKAERDPEWQRLEAEIEAANRETIPFGKALIQQDDIEARYILQEAARQGIQLEEEPAETLPNRIKRELREAEAKKRKK